MEPNLLLPASPYLSLDEYLAAGGGRALAAARAQGAGWVLDELDRAGLRGRGGAGFPAGDAARGRAGHIGHGYRGTWGGQCAGRRRKRFLSPIEKYEIWLGLLRGEISISEAADRSGVDRSTVMKLRTVAKQGALDALAQSRPGVKANQVDPELADARAEIARLAEALKEICVRLMLVAIHAIASPISCTCSVRDPLRTACATFTRYCR